MKIDQILQHEKCAVCYSLRVEFFLSCDIYDGWIDSRKLRVGERCPFQEVIDEDLRKFVLDYTNLSMRPVAERIMANAPRER